MPSTTVALTKSAKVHRLKLQPRVPHAQHFEPGGPRGEHDGIHRVTSEVVGRIATETENLAGSVGGDDALLVTDTRFEVFKFSTLCLPRFGESTLDQRGFCHAGEGVVCQKTGYFRVEIVRPAYQCKIDLQSRLLRGEDLLNGSISGGVNHRCPVDKITDFVL